MQDQPPNASSSVDARAATIKLVFKKALLSKLGHSASSAAEQLIDDPEDAAPDTPKTSEKKNGKQSAASGAKSSSKANAASSKAATPKSATSKASSTPSKAAVVKPSPKAALSKVAPKKAPPQRQKRSENPIDAASITSELGRCVVSSTAGLDLADTAGDSIPFTRVKRMMKDLLGDMKLSNESVAAVICSCHGFINYMTLQVSRLRPLVRPSTTLMPSYRLPKAPPNLIFATMISQTWCKITIRLNFWMKSFPSALPPRMPLQLTLISSWRRG
jgi:hypothetical protein